RRAAIARLTEIVSAPTLDGTLCCECACKVETCGNLLHTRVPTCWECHNKNRVSGNKQCEPGSNKDPEFFRPPGRFDFLAIHAEILFWSRYVVYKMHRLNQCTNPRVSSTIRVPGFRMPVRGYG